MKRFLIVTLVLTILVTSIASISCNTQDKNNTKTEQLGQMPDKAANNSVHVSDAEQHVNYDSVAFPKADTTSDIAKAIKGQSTSYKTESGRVFYRCMLDLDGSGAYVRFNVTWEKGHMIILFDVGHDINDKEFETAISKWQRIENNEISILVDPSNNEEITQYPAGGDFYIFEEDGKYRTFSVGSVSFEETTDDFQTQYISL